MKTFLTMCAVIAGLVLLPGQASGVTASVADHVQINGDQIFLSDLLPAGAPEDLSHCATIALGKSPVLGSMRILTKSQINRSLEHCPASVREILIPDQVVVKRAGHRISAQAIEKALIKYLGQTNITIIIDPRELSWPREQEAQNLDPQLAVAGSSWDATQHRWQFLLRCSNRKVCSPFLVNLHGKPDLFKNAQVPQVHTGKDPAPLVRRGQKAWLLLDDGRIRVSLQVTCLQNGAIGERIRVLDSTNHHFLRGEVVAPQLLKAAS